MKISVILIDGQFRENTYSADYLCKQDFPENEYEIIWVEYYKKVPASVTGLKKIKIVRLEHTLDTVYHSSVCFNKGIEHAAGELIVIPDADQIMAPDFLSQLWSLHSSYDKLVVYPYRYDEQKQGDVTSPSFEELENKCILKNPKNYGGCLSVRKKWLLEINGYEQHKIFESGFHANGLDMYTRFKNYGLAILWAPHIKMYHPWHPFTLEPANEYVLQFELIEWRAKTLQFLALNGLSASKNYKHFDEAAFRKMASEKKPSPPKPGIIKRMLNRI